jgi:AAA15 family ATPase/GTPase
MLLRYGISNFLSFKEGAEISFQLDGKVPISISGGRDYATILCVKGANGSGKTHLLKGLAFMANFATRSFGADPDSEIPVDPFFDSGKPSEFFVEFAVGGSSYLYELSVTKKQVVCETLYQTKRRKTKLFERNESDVSAIKRMSVIESIKLRKNASLISTAHQHEVSDLEPVYEFFNKIVFNVTKTGFANAPKFSNLNNISKFLLDNPRSLVPVKAFINECDIGISDITIASEDGEDGTKKYYPVFHHKVGGKSMKVFPSTESHGTMHLYRLLLAYFSTIHFGGVLIADEFDAFLHPKILPKILDLFIDPEVNGKGAQLIFSAHDSEVLDICGKYRTYLVNKDENASYAYRMDEIQGDLLRNDRSIAAPYREGRVGGVPRI